MTTARRYESGRLVSDKRAAPPTLGWGKKDDELPAATAALQPDTSTDDTTEEPDMRAAPAKVVRRPPPAIIPDTKLEEAVCTVPRDSPPSVPPPCSTADADERIEDTSDMRKFLLRQMVRAAKGEITSETVKNIVTLSQQVYNATSLELKAAAILKSTDKSIRALELVSPQDNGGD